VLQYNFLEVMKFRINKEPKQKVESAIGAENKRNTKDPATLHLTINELDLNYIRHFFLDALWKLL